MKSTKSKLNLKLLMIGIIVILSTTILSQAAAIFLTLFSKSQDEAINAFASIASVLRVLLDIVIFSAGAALILAFVRIGDRLCTVYAYLAAMTVLALDYGASFIIDLSYGLISGSMELSLIIFIVNYIFRGIVYVLLISFARKIYKKRGCGEVPIPFFSLGHPMSRMLGTMFILRIAPYLVFEIYSNITGIITYGFDMTPADVLSIISAYVEILIDGALAYCAAYILLVAFSKLSIKKAGTEEE